MTKRRLFKINITNAHVVVCATAGVHLLYISIITVAQGIRWRAKWPEFGPRTVELVLKALKAPFGWVRRLVQRLINAD